MPNWAWGDCTGTGVHVGAESAWVHVGAEVHAWLGTPLCKVGKGLSGVLSTTRQPAQLINPQRARNMFPASHPQRDWAQSSLSPLSVSLQQFFSPFSPHTQVRFYTQSLSLSLKLPGTEALLLFPTGKGPKHHTGRSAPG